MSFNEFLAGYKADELEEVRKVQTVGTDFSELLRKYELELDRFELFLEVYNSNITEVLTPSEINSFLQTTQQFGGHQNYSWCTGRILSVLLQNSYNKGYNHFNLETRNLPRISGIGYLIGKEENHLILSVQGNVGIDVGRKTQYSTFTINGEIWSGCGLKAKHSTFTYNGAVGDLCGLEAKNCTFKTSIWENVAEMKKSINPYNRNTLIYIDHGEEVRIFIA